MRRLFLTACLCLTLSYSAYAQSSYPSVGQLKGDYKSVPVVAHVEIQNTELVDTLGEHYLYAVYGRVVEPLKGNVKRGQALKFYVQVDKGYDMGQHHGGRIVFLNRSINGLDKKSSLFELENSSVPYSRKIIDTMRRIKSLSKKDRSR